jgi:RimJ/RimL family protein N-acetyltransferase
MIKTSRLTIEPLDYKGLLRYIFERKGAAKTDSEESEMLEYVLEPYRKAEEKDKLFYTIWVARNEDGEAVGDCNFKGAPNDVGIIEIADYVYPEHRNKGYSTEMMSGMIDWASEKEETVFVLASIDKENKPSLRVINKCGFRNIGFHNERLTFLKQLKF